MFENIINKTIKLSYFNYRNNDRKERWILGKLISEDTNFVQIKGMQDGTIFTINKSHIIELVETEVKK